MVDELDDDILKDLSRDQKLLYHYCQAVGTGHVPPDLAVQVAGPLNHARWLTLAVRLLQLYTRTETPSEALVKIITYIIQVYSPMWFAIR